jgi:hypothetical protein
MEFDLHGSGRKASHEDGWSWLLRRSGRVEMCRYRLEVLRNNRVHSTLHTHPHSHSHTHSHTHSLSHTHTHSLSLSLSLSLFNLPCAREYLRVRTYLPVKSFLCLEVLEDRWPTHLHRPQKHPNLGRHVAQHSISTINYQLYHIMHIIIPTTRATTLSGGLKPTP